MADFNCHSSKILVRNLIIALFYEFNCFRFSRGILKTYHITFLLSITLRLNVPSLQMLELHETNLNN